MFTTRFAVFLTLAIVATVAPAAHAAPVNMTWNVGGAQRSAIVYAPANAATTKVPVVFAFHGFGDTNDNFQGVGMEEAWPQAIVVYPQGLPVTRNGATLPGWQSEKGGNGDRDLLFVDAALTSLRSKYKVDDSRVYATGFSNGAIFTFLLWAERPGVFAALSAVAGRLATGVVPAVPKPFLQVGGKDDGNIPFAQQEQAMAAARRVNGVAKGEGCGRNCTLYPSASGTPVITVIHDGGHEWPEGISQRIAKFFQSYSLSH